MPAVSWGTGQRSTWMCSHSPSNTPAQRTQITQKFNNSFTLSYCVGSFASKMEWAKWSDIFSKYFMHQLATKSMYIQQLIQKHKVPSESVSLFFVAFSWKACSICNILHRHALYCHCHLYIWLYTERTKSDSLVEYKSVGISKYEYVLKVLKVKLAVIKKITNAQHTPNATLLQINTIKNLLSSTSENCTHTQNLMRFL